MGGFCPGGFVWKDFVLGGILSRGFCLGGFVPEPLKLTSSFKNQNHVFNPSSWVTHDMLQCMDVTQDAGSVLSSLLKSS